MKDPIPFEGWITMAVVAVCVFIAIVYSVYVKRRQAEVIRLTDAVITATEKLNQVVCALNVQTNHTCEAMNGLAIAIKKSVDYNFTMQKNKAERRDKE